MTRKLIQLNYESTTNSVLKEEGAQTMEIETGYLKTEINQNLRLLLPVIDVYEGKISERKAIESIIEYFTSVWKKHEFSEESMRLIEYVAHHHLSDKMEENNEQLYFNGGKYMPEYLIGHMESCRESVKRYKDLQIDKLRAYELLSDNKVNHEILQELYRTMDLERDSLDNALMEFDQVISETTAGEGNSIPMRKIAQAIISGWPALWFKRHTYKVIKELIKISKDQEYENREELRNIIKKIDV